MTNAEFALMNEGSAAPTIASNGSFGGFESGAITASSADGTTTVTLNSGYRTDANIRLLAQRIRRADQAYNLTFTP
ncbi:MULTISPECIES: hypothetical protein [Calothrix]|uniref:Uncharacterized protein n=2 Tax=Calothrix TaxID=1186 RepID=A0ABR8AJL5_9CYAN|nr:MULTISPECIES: hypothetical protein [Calothrix]MBD2200158.1 hypothetical protein [Calothrix parietina FACHB-288]MBD2229132.1 hypothetical protein [Calothrix anomala FACHB-343]